MHQFRNSPETYGIISRTIHWGTVLIVFMQFIYGISASILRPDPLAGLVTIVESFGMILVPLTIVRIMWIIASPNPDLPPSVTKIQAAIARFVQYGIYGLILASATTGFMVRVQDTFFYVIDLRGFLLFSQSAAINHLHDALVYTLLCFVCVHISAALLHAYQRDGVLKTMTG